MKRSSKEIFSNESTFKISSHSNILHDPSQTFEIQNDKIVKLVLNWNFLSCKWYRFLWEAVDGCDTRELQGIYRWTVEEKIIKDTDTLHHLREPGLTTKYLKRGP